MLRQVVIDYSTLATKNTRPGLNTYFLFTKGEKSVWKKDVGGAVLWGNICLAPLKRFHLPVSLYVEPLFSCCRNKEAEFYWNWLVNHSPISYMMERVQIVDKAGNPTQEGIAVHPVKDTSLFGAACASIRGGWEHPYRKDLFYKFVNDNKVNPDVAVLLSTNFSEDCTHQKTLSQHCWLYAYEWGKKAVDTWLDHKIEERSPLCESVKVCGYWSFSSGIRGGQRAGPYFSKKLEEHFFSHKDEKEIKKIDPWGISVPLVRELLKKRKHGSLKKQTFEDSLASFEAVLRSEKDV